MANKQRLSGDGTKRLLEIGLTKEQIFWIDQYLPIIVEDLRQPSPHREVRKELQKIAGYLAKIDGWCEQAKKSTLRQADKVAYGHIGMAAAQWIQSTDADQHDSAIPERMDLHVFANSFRQIVEMAEKKFPPMLKQPRRSAIGVIERIEAAIHRPEDDASREAAKKFQLREKSNLSFLELAEIIFKEATGKEDASPDYAIRELVKQRSRSIPTG